MRRMNRMMIGIILMSFFIAGCSAESNSSKEEEISETNEIKEDATVSYLGPEGTYTEETTKFFFSNGTFQPKETVMDAIEDVKLGDADYAVIPQENTLGGAVTNYVDALIEQENIYVVGGVILPISQTLMGIEGATLEDIQVVCSHAQGLVQSEKWREEYLPNASAQEMASTAAAASYVSEMKDKSIAAIGAPSAADVYGLTVLAENVQITDTNQTRFYVLSTSPLQGEGYTNAVFVVTCEANRIDDILVQIHDMGVELVTIHDCPEGSHLGNYHYIIEIEDSDGITNKLIGKLESIPELRYFGRFDVKMKDSDS